MNTIQEHVDVVVAGCGTAGRIVSADTVAVAGIRAQCTGTAMGQAMGAAAALTVQRGVTSREIPSQDTVAATI